jgi:hypothetical protein
MNNTVKVIIAIVLLVLNILLFATSYFAPHKTFLKAMEVDGRISSSEAYEKEQDLIASVDDYLNYIEGSYDVNLDVTGYEYTVNPFMTTGSLSNYATLEINYVNNVNSNDEILNVIDDFNILYDIISADLEDNVDGDFILEISATILHGSTSSSYEMQYISSDTIQIEHNLEMRTDFGTTMEMSQMLSGYLDLVLDESGINSVLVVASDGTMYYSRYGNTDYVTAVITLYNFDTIDRANEYKDALNNIITQDLNYEITKSWD